MLTRIKQWLKDRKTQPLEDWYSVEFDNQLVRITADPPEKDRWETKFSWVDVIRVGFKDEGPYVSDGIYVWTHQRAESYVVPVEAAGGEEFLFELRDRGLFPNEIFTEAMTSTDGGWYFWPREGAGT